MDITIHHHYSKTGRDAQAKGDRKPGISWREGVLLLAAAVFCVFCLGYGRSSGGVTVHVQRQLEAVAQEQEAEGWPDSLLPGEQIDLNTAPEKDLQRLPGIGESRASEIAQHRARHGSFERVEDITQVFGIGEGILEQIRPYVTVGGE